MKVNNRVVIIGAGIAGCFLAIKLARNGYKVTIYEKGTKRETISVASKRSFNITLYGYGLGLLKDAGLLPQLRKSITKLNGSVTFIGNNAKPIISYVNRKATYYAVQRANLLSVLSAEALSTKNVTVHFEHEFLTLNKIKKTVTVRNGKTGRTHTISASLVVGCDGVNSRVRDILLSGKGALLNKKYSKWCYKQVVFSPATVKKLSMSTKYAYTWSSKKAVVATFPNKDKSSTAIFILPQKDFFENEKFIKRLIQNEFSSLKPITESIIRQVKDNPMGRFVTIHTKPWHYKDFIVIIGDAAHGFYPFFGQGISAAMGDANELVKLLVKNKGMQERALLEFENSRKRHMDTLGELSKGGFELYRRYKKANYDIIYNRLETLLHHIFPRLIVPSVFESINVDPGKTDDYVRRHKKQRERAKYLALPFFVTALTGLYSLYERVITQKWLSAFNRRKKPIHLASHEE